ncbi:MAG TPA: AAA family ATPase [Myxococcales bacterium]|jgi:predicted ATPase
MPRRPRPSRSFGEGIVRTVALLRERVTKPDAYPFSIPAIRALETLELDPKVTFFVGENGAGKSTLVEAIAVAAGFNPEGGSKNFRFETRRSESELHQALRIARGTRRERDGFFLRAESYFNVATEIDRLDSEPSFGPPVIDGFGGVPLHEMSHGESFLALANNRLRGEGLYVFDEPEAALSPGRQLSLLKILWRLSKQGSQFIIATHSPILMAFPGARIYLLDGSGIRTVAYEETEHFQVTRGFLLDRERYFRHLFESDEDETEDGDEGEAG